MACVTVGATGGGSSSRRGGCGRGGMAVVGGLVGGKGLGREFAGTGGRECTVSRAENQVVVVLWACEE